MRFCLLTLFVLLLLVPDHPLTAQPQDSVFSLMPQPRSLTPQEGHFRLAADFTITIEGSPHARLYPAATRILRRLSGRSGLFFPQQHIVPGSPVDSASMRIVVRQPGEIRLHSDEGYRLVIDRASITLTAPTDLGAMHGMETLLQLLAADINGYYFPALVIEDAPRFPWRGLLIDVSRHYQPLAVLKRNLDGMAAVKLNVLHWHLVDDQGFRVQSKSYPRLHEMGSDGFYYTHEQIGEVIDYAAARGIRVVPEFDVPAHATSWLVGYPELGSAPGPYEIERNWGIHDPTLNPVNPRVYTFLDTFFAEMAALFPDEYLHIGGDENNGKHWGANEEIQAFMKKNNIADLHALQTYFNKQVLKILTRHGKKMVGWDEIFQPELPHDAVIHSWRGHQALREAARQGYYTILSNGYYIDLAHSAETHYVNDPLPEDAGLSDEAARFILGGEATMWGEMVSTETIDSRIWPRTAAIAERLWSPREVRDVDDMYRRLARLSLQMEELGLTHRKNYEMMLRRLCNYGDIRALRNLVDVVEPVKNYERHHQGVKYTQSSPLTRVVDAARPESMTARYFAQLVDALLADPADGPQEEIADLLRLWKGNHRELQKVITASPVLAEIASMSADLATISELALRAGKYVSAGQTLSSSWVTRSLEIVDAARAPRGQTFLKVVGPIEKLIRAAGPPEGADGG